MAARGSGFVWISKPTAVFPQLVDGYIAAVRAGCRGIAERRAPEIANWLRDNAPWQDRTANARQSLHTSVEESTNELALYLAHGVVYGVHLELRNSGRWAVLSPALDYWSPIILQDVKEMLGQ